MYRSRKAWGTLHVQRSHRHKPHPSQKAASWGSSLLRGQKKNFFLHDVEINLPVMLGRELGRVWSWISGWPDGVGLSAPWQLTRPLAVGRRLPSRLSAHTSLLPVTCIALALNCLHGVPDRLCPGWLWFPNTINVPTATAQGEAWRVLSRLQFDVCKVLIVLTAWTNVMLSQSEQLSSLPTLLGLLK